MNGDWKEYETRCASKDLLFYGKVIIYSFKAGSLHGFSQSLHVNISKINHNCFFYIHPKIVGSQYGGVKLNLRMQDTMHVESGSSCLPNVALDWSVFLLSILQISG